MSTVDAMYDEANQLKEAGKLEESVAKLKEIIQQDENFALAHAALAVACGKLGEHEEAVAHAQRVCELEPQEAFSFTALSVVFQRAFAGTGNQAFIQAAEDAMARARMIEGGM